MKLGKEFLETVANMNLPKPKTNYDLLISKTPEELAEWLIKEAYFCADPKRFCSDEPCLPCVVSWLKSPVEVEA